MLFLVEYTMFSLVDVIILVIFHQVDVPVHQTNKQKYLYYQDIGAE